MSQRSSVEAPGPSSSTELQPALAAALGTLDVSLEEELSHYRRHRQRAEQWVSPATRAGSKPIRPTLELSPGSSLPSLSSNIQTSDGAETEVKSVRPPLVITQRNADATLATRQSQQPLSASDVAPDDYLESSEDLIKSLEEENQAATEPSLLASLFTPLGISSLLLFLLSCIALGYAVLHPPALFANLGLGRFLPQNSPDPAGSPLPADSATLPKAPNLASKEFVELDLSTLSNLKPTPTPIPVASAKPSIPPSPKPVPGLPPAPTNQPPIEPINGPVRNDQGLNNLGRALLPKPTPPAVVVTLPTPASPAAPTAPTPTAPASAPAASPTTPVKATDGYYYVVLDYTGESSLEQARKAVPDAYIRDYPSGTKIQMGALADAVSAQQLMKELQDQGLSAKYDQP